METIQDAAVSQINEQFDALVAQDPILKESMTLAHHGYPSDVCLKVAVLAMSQRSAEQGRAATDELLVHPDSLE